MQGRLSTVGEQCDVKEEQYDLAYYRKKGLGTADLLAKEEKIHLRDPGYDSNDARRDIQKVARCLGLVVRLVGSKSPELKDPKAISSMHAEMKTIEQAVSPNEVFECDVVKATRPGPRFVRGMLLTYIKNEESNELRKWKPRFVALGNRLFDFFGGKIEEELRHFVPSSLAAMRLSVLWELMVPSGVGLR